MINGERHVLIRVDAGMGIGFGHITRCLALARDLAGRGVGVTVAARTPTSEILRRIGDAGAEAIALPGPGSEEPADGPVWDSTAQRRDAVAVMEYQPSGGWDAVVVDHYRLDRVWEATVAEVSARLVVIDDLANRPHAADVVVDHNWYGNHNAYRYQDLTERGTLLLLGPRYAMLHPRYAIARKRRGPVHCPPQRVLVSFGGTDVGQQTLEAAKALLEVPRFRIDAVLGTPQAVSPELEHLAQEPRVRLHVGLPNLVERLSEADLVFGAGGTATWERLCMGVPAVVTTVSENQSGVTRAFHDAGMTFWLGTAAQVTIDDYRKAIQMVMAGYAPTPMPIVDGHGAARVGLAVLPPAQPRLTVRPAERSDIASYVTSGAQGADGPEAWRARADQFSVDLQTPGGVQLIEHGGVPVGNREVVDGVDTDWLDTYLASESSTGETQ